MHFRYATVQDRLYQFREKISARKMFSKRTSVTVAEKRVMVRAGLHQRDTAATAHLQRDWRGWAKPSHFKATGRSAHWEPLNFARIGSIARQLHRDGFPRALISPVARKLNNYDGDYPVASYPADVDPPILGLPVAPWRQRQIAEPLGTSVEPARPAPANIERAIAWEGYLRHILQPAVGRDKLGRILAGLAADPTKRVGGYLADSIKSWRQGNGGYEGCSGCEYLGALKLRPELWDELWDRRAHGGLTESGEIIVLPHEEPPGPCEDYEVTFMLSFDVWKPIKPKSQAAYA